MKEISEKSGIKLVKFDTPFFMSVKVPLSKFQNRIFR